MIRANSYGISREFESIEQLAEIVAHEIKCDHCGGIVHPKDIQLVPPYFNRYCLTCSGILASLPKPAIEIQGELF